MQLLEGEGATPGLDVPQCKSSLFLLVPPRQGGQAHSEVDRYHGMCPITVWHLSGVRFLIAVLTCTVLYMYCLHISAQIQAVLGMVFSIFHYKYFS